MISKLSRWWRTKYDKANGAIQQPLPLSAADKHLIEEYRVLARINANRKLHEVPTIAVDFETTGLEKNDQIISMGFCPIVGGKIILSNCTHLIVNPEKQLTNKSVTIHNITDDQVRQGVSRLDALKTFLSMTKGAIIIAHYHSIERKFIQNLAKQLTGSSLPLNFFDTFELEKQKRLRRHQVIATNSLRLFNLRKDYGLPKYNAHNALEDAIATAELFLAQIAQLAHSENALRLKDVGLIQIRK